MAKKIRRAFLLSVGGLLLTALCAGGFVLTAWVRSAPKLNMDALQLDLTSFIYAPTGEGDAMEELVRLHDRQNRVWAGLGSIPPHMRNAVIATEDKRFWKHKGVDIRRTAHAVLRYVTKGSSDFGGSTIAQQLVKNLTMNDAVSVKRKVQEMWLALRLEREIGKERVLELYLNTVFFGEGAYGVQAAAYTYFARDVTELSVAQAAAIAGITQLPQKYNPLIDPVQNKEKQEVVLGEMYAQGLIGGDVYHEAMGEELVFSRTGRQEGFARYPYFVDQILDDVLDDLQAEKGYTRAMASKLLYTGGLRIYATLSPRVQESLEAVFAEDGNFPDDASGERTNAAMLVLDPATGEVKGIVGGRGEKTGQRTLNRATQSVRQPGSAIKPIAVYAPALDHSLITAQTELVDEPYTLDGWSPRNWYGGHWGRMTVARAVEQSVNIVAVKVLAMVGIERSFEFMKNNLGVTTLVDRDVRGGASYTDKVYNALSLGGLTDGMTVREMAAAYAPFVNRGVYIKPHTYTRVAGHDGETILDQKTDTAPRIAMREQTAYTMTQLLSGVVARGTGTAARLARGMPAAGKTGTTSDDKDRWFVGYTPYYVGAVWFGYDLPRPMTRLLAGRSNPAAVIWKKSMDLIHQELPRRDFPALSWDGAGGNRGLLRLSDQRIYEGEIQNGKANGKGVMTYPNGDRYVGGFSDNARAGQGTLFYANGNQYEGSFEGDGINGRGVLVYPNGDCYSGEWQDGKFSGEGTFTWSNGDSYTGGWANEKMEGYGVFRWANGNRYEGEWADGSFHGTGIFYWVNGDITSGRWEQGAHIKVTEESLSP